MAELPDWYVQMDAARSAPAQPSASASPAAPASSVPEWYAQMDAQRSAATAQPQVNSPINATNLARSFSRGVPIIGGLLDEADAATNAALDPVAHAVFGTPQIPGSSFSERYTNELANQRGMDKTFDQAHPIVSTGAQLAGGIASAGALAKAAPAAAEAVFGTGTGPLSTQIAQGVGKGITLGGADAFTRGEGGFGNRIANAERGAEIGGVIGGIAPAVAAGAGRVFGSRPSVPTTDELSDQADILYGAAKKSGVAVKGTVFNKMAADLEDLTRNQDILDPVLHPKANRAMDRLLGAARDPNAPAMPLDMDIKDIDKLRRIVGVAAQSKEPDEARIAAVMRDHIDDFLDNLTPNDVAGGNTKNVGQILSDARGLWSRMRKGEIIDELSDRAQIKSAQGGNLGQAVTAEFKSLALNRNQMRRFSPSEQDAIRDVAQGGNITKFLTAISKTGQGLPAKLIALGGMLSGHPEAMAPSLAGEAAKLASTAVTTAKAKNVADMMRNGAPVPQRQFTPDQHQALIRRLASSIPTVAGLSR